MSDRQRTRTTRWDVAKLLVMIPAFVWGLRNIPEAVEGIWFVQVLPAMFLAGLSLIFVDGIRLCWVQYRGANSRQEAMEVTFSSFAIVAVAILVLIPVGRIWNRIRPFYNRVSR